MSIHIAEVQKLISASGVKYSMHSAGTTLGEQTSLSIVYSANFDTTEGSWDEVMTVIGKAHALLHNNGVVRIQSDIRVGSR